ncbi:hypothetical protein DPMN_177280 [Dreissena polymorpha]|uniref:Uncharacterized protein n=1 Tax=Dreissena polymorpha TaxID=45954 RepID=A0A9D4EAX5_DREPO|nr:hypothetical protein DPMN_177280 [Dreissena polymorpha]
MPSGTLRRALRLSMTQIMPCDILPTPNQRNGQKVNFQSWRKMNTKRRSILTGFPTSTTTMWSRVAP